MFHDLAVAMAASAGDPISRSSTRLQSATAEAAAAADVEDETGPRRDLRHGAAPRSATWRAATDGPASLRLFLRPPGETAPLPRPPASSTVAELVLLAAPAEAGFVAAGELLDPDRF